MTKLLNKRPLFFCFIALGFGIFFAKPILSLNAVTISFVISAFSIVCYLCIKHKVFLSLLLVIVSFLIGIGAFLISVNSFNAKDYLSSSLNISGRVQIVTNYEFSQNLILDNVYVNKEKINYNICVSIYSFGGY